MTLVLIGWIIMIARLRRRRRTFGRANLAGLHGRRAGRRPRDRRLPPRPREASSSAWVAVKAASIFGPLTYGAVTWIFAGDHRLGILAVGAYFVVGLALLPGLDMERGRRAALEAG
jgi:UMF1 family MFS transporter